MKILFIGELSDWSQYALSYLRAQDAQVTSIIWSKGMPNYKIIDSWRGDWILSFKSDLILSAGDLERPKYGAINFHPAPPYYRGIGGYWHALQNHDISFGCTSHYMDEKIDHGAIIDVRMFDILHNTNLSKLYLQTARLCLEQFKQTTDFILNGTAPSPIKEKWKGRLYKSSELPSKYFDIIKSCNKVQFFGKERKLNIYPPSNIRRY